MKKKLPLSDREREDFIEKLEKMNSEEINFLQTKLEKKRSFI